MDTLIHLLFSSIRVGFDKWRTLEEEKWALKMIYHKIFSIGDRIVVTYYCNAKILYDLFVNICSNFIMKMMFTSKGIRFFEKCVSNFHKN